MNPLYRGGGGGICAAVQGLVDLFIPACVSAAEASVPEFFWACSVPLQSGTHEPFWMLLVLTCGRREGDSLCFLLVFPEVF